MLKGFDLSGKVAVITGGLGFMGPMHADAIAQHGGIPVVADLPEVVGEDRLPAAAGQGAVFGCDVTRREAARGLLDKVLARYGRVDILINNAANNPKVTAAGLADPSRFEEFTLEAWQADIAVTLTGAFLCCQVFGSWMALHGGGVILNVASDLGVVAPDQRLYRKEGLADDQQPVKPVTYSVAKHGVVGLTKYLATYWKNVRVNAISPGGVYNEQPEEFVGRLCERIPMGRMARRDEWQGAVVFLCSDASSYITGQNLIIDGGRSVW